MYCYSRAMYYYRYTVTLLYYSVYGRDVRTVTPELCTITDTLLHHYTVV